MKNLILEIGCEELPASYIEPALAWLLENVKKGLGEARIPLDVVSTFGTPRRLVVIVRGLAESQSDLSHEVLGPRAEAAWDAAGQLTAQAKGFLSAKKIDESLAYRKDTPKGEVLAAQLFEKGKDTQLVLSELLPQIICGIPFPKVMKWESSGATFARPIRWILSILDDQIIPFEFAGVKSGAQTTGHRFMSPEWVKIANVENYLESMSEKYVMLDSEKRRSVILKQAQALAKEQGGTLVEDDALLDIVKNLVEYPWPLLGQFESRYLEIPKEILICEMREHQKYFAVQDKNGRLLPCFVVVAGSNPKNAQGVADGHARVLRARFEDGSFYYYEDLKQPFNSNVAKLERVQFQRELGSVLDKVNRIEKLTSELCDQFKWDDDAKATTAKAARLCKADLVSGVVAQFPELQGVMGSYYAAKSGESDAVSMAIREHYWPRFGADSIPSTPAGCIVSMADKLDTLVGVIGVGKAPKGNADPFGLRRAGIAIARMIIESGFRISLRQLVQMSLETYGDRLKMTQALEDEIAAFILGRARGVFQIPVALIDAAIAAGSDDIADLSARIAAVNQLHKTDAESFSQLAAALKRAGNIVSKAVADKAFEPTSKLDPALLQAPSEKKLFTELQKTMQKIDGVMANGSQVDLQKRYVEMMQEIANLKPYVDHFFDEVMVMTDDVSLRTARLALLHRLQSAVSVIADFTRVQL